MAAVHANFPLISGRLCFVFNSAFCTASVNMTALTESTSLLYDMMIVLLLESDQQIISPVFARPAGSFQSSCAGKKLVRQGCKGKELGKASVVCLQDDADRADEQMPPRPSPLDWKLNRKYVGTPFAVRFLSLSSSHSSPLLAYTASSKSDTLVISSIGCG